MRSAAFFLILGLALGFRSGRLEFVGNEPIQSTARAFAMRRSDGSVATWGNASFGGDSSSVQSQLKNVKALCGTCGVQSGAFAAIVGDDNTVICWGDEAKGGDCSAVASELREVEGICSSAGAFAALKRDGTVITWGHKGYGGDSSSVQSRLKGVKAIYSTYFAFAAVLEDGTVEAWGKKAHGGLVSPPIRERLKQVQLVSGTLSAFAALLRNGKVEAWGDQGYGGDSSVVRELTQVMHIYASNSAFAALRLDGTVVSWGKKGESSQVDELKQVVAIASTGSAFAAVRGDGSVVTWGEQAYGGDSSSVAGELKEVVAIQGTAFAFAALRKDGTVTTWGSADLGGDISQMKSELTGVISISSTARAFAAWRRDGTVVTWGDKGAGAVISFAVWLDSQAKAVQVLAQVLLGCMSLVSFAKIGDFWGFVAAFHIAGLASLITFILDPAIAALLIAVAAVSIIFIPKRHQPREKQQELKAFAGLVSFAKFGDFWGFVAALLTTGLVIAFVIDPADPADPAIAALPLAAVAVSIYIIFILKRHQPREKQQELKAFAGASSVTATTATLRDGSAEFWVQQLQGVLDEEDIPEAASKLSAAKLKQKHIGELSEDELISIGFNQGTAMDFREHSRKGTNRQTCLSPKPTKQEVKHTGNVPMYVPPALKQLPRIPDKALTMEEMVGKDESFVVWRATWTRTIRQQVQSMPVVVKMLNHVASHRDNRLDFALSDLARDLAVISALPHQNILTLHGVCGGLSNELQGIKFVSERMSTNLATMLKPALDKLKSAPLLPQHALLRVLCDVSAGLAHLHSHGVVHRDVKPANILLRDEQVKLCDFGSSKCEQLRDFGESKDVHQMAMAGTLDYYLAPEALEQQSWGRPADVWSFGVLLFECVTGRACAHKAKMEDLRQELTQRGCLPALVEMFEECRAEEPSKRPSMLDICDQLQRLVMQEAVDSHRLKEELKRAEAQDRDTYEMTWNESYGNQPYLKELLDYSKQLPSQQDVRQPKGSMEELGQLALLVGGRLHESLKELVEGCGGTYLVGPRKKYERCVQKVNQEYGGDFGKLLDLERATGLFDRAEDMLLCLQRVHEGSARHVNHFASSSSSSLSSPTSSPSCCSCCSFSSPPTSFSTFTSRPSIVRVVRCKDRLNNPRDSGYRDILLNVCEEQSGFVAELQLNFHKIAQINSQSHRFYEFMRVMQLRM